MPKRLRWTHRFPVAMTEEGYRRLKRFAKDSNLEKGEARTVLFENFNSVINEDTFGQRLRMFQNELEDRKRWKEEYLGKSEGKDQRPKEVSHQRSAPKGAGASLFTAIGSPACSALIIFNIVLK